MVGYVMPNTVRKPPPSMTVADFLAWPGDGTGRKFQLVDGEVRAMSPASAVHAIIQANLAYELRRHPARAENPRVGWAPSRVFSPVIRADINVRVPDVGVTCTRARASRSAGMARPDPADRSPLAWERRRHVGECLVLLHDSQRAGDRNRPLDAGARGAPAARAGWPLAGGDRRRSARAARSSFESIGFSCPLFEVYAETPLGGERPTP